MKFAQVWACLLLSVLAGCETGAEPAPSPQVPEPAASNEPAPVRPTVAWTAALQRGLSEGVGRSRAGKQAVAAVLHCPMVPLLPPDGWRGVHQSAGREPLGEIRLRFGRCRQCTRGLPAVPRFGISDGPVCIAARRAIEPDRRQATGPPGDDGHASRIADRRLAQPAERLDVADSSARRAEWLPQADGLDRGISHRGVRAYCFRRQRGRMTSRARPTRCMAQINT